MKNTSYNNFFANFSNKTKLEIMFFLSKSSSSVNEIAKQISEEQSNVSHHLKSLANCHILNVKRIGKQRFYSLNKETVFPMLELVEKHIRNNSHVNCRGCSKCQ